MSKFVTFATETDKEYIFNVDYIMMVEYRPQRSTIGIPPKLDIRMRDSRTYSFTGARAEHFYSRLEELINDPRRED
jgi:hypothetical protein